MTNVLAGRHCRPRCQRLSVMTRRYYVANVCTCYGHATKSGTVFRHVLRMQHDLFDWAVITHVRSQFTVILALKLVILHEGLWECSSN